MSNAMLSATPGVPAAAVDSGPQPVLREVTRRRIGPSDLVVHPVALSGNVFGWTADDTAVESILDAYVGGGGNFLDTADSYASGRSEIMIGNWMRQHRNRDELVLATKIGKSADNPGLSARSVTRAVEASLERLGTDRIDLLYLHVDDELVPFDETLLAVDELIRSGKVRYFGASDHTANRLIEARIASAQLDVARMVALQNKYNLLARAEYENGLAHVAARQDLGVMPRFGLASGYLTGKYRTRRDVKQSGRGKELAVYLTRSNARVLALVESIARSQGVAPASVALAWLLSRPFVVAPVVSASSAEQVRDLMIAPAMELSAVQLAELDRVSARLR